MAYLKSNEAAKAEKDCDEALKLNSLHLKSLLRRSAAKRRLGNY